MKYQPCINIWMGFLVVFQKTCTAWRKTLVTMLTISCAGAGRWCHLVGITESISHDIYANTHRQMYLLIRIHNQTYFKSEASTALSHCSTGPRHPKYASLPSADCSWGLFQWKHDQEYIMRNKRKIKRDNIKKKERKY